MYNFKVRCLQVEVTMCICENQSLDRTLNDRAIRIFRSILLMNGSVGGFLWNLFWVYVIVSGENKEPTQHTIHIMRVTAECCWYQTLQLPSLYNTDFGGNSEMMILDLCDKVEDLIRQRKLTDLDCSRFWKAAEERREHHITTYPTHEAPCRVIFVGAIK